MPLAKLLIIQMVLLLLSGSLALAEPIIIRFNTGMNQTPAKTKACEYFKHLVEQRSNKRIRVKLLPGRSQLDAHRPLKQLKDSSSQMAAPQLSVLFNEIPKLQQIDLPFLFRNNEQLHDLIRAEGEAKSFKDLNGLTPLSFWDSGAKQLTANRPLIEPQDFEGLIFHLTGSATSMKQFRTLGAKPWSIQRSRLYMSLKTGAVDGQENTLANIYHQKLFQVQSNLTISNHGYLGYLILANNHFWEQLPKDLKVIIQGALRNVAAYTREMATKIDQDALKSLRATGLIKIRVLTAEERERWRKKLMAADPRAYNIGKTPFHKTREAKIR